jgi:pyruvate dehydrogenase E1 component
MVPFFIFYSMFGFQRVGDLIWAAADARTRGFLLGATAGRTTLLGEGLQHQDGHSHVLASSVPTCQAYDPAFAFEMAAIIRDGLHRMYGGADREGADEAELGEAIFYYLTLYNENYEMPAKPDHVDAADICNGMYRFEDAPAGDGPRATILFSGTAHLAAREARDDLLEHYGVRAELWSVTSYKALREQALSTQRWNRLHPLDEPRVPLVTEQLAGAVGPIVAVTDFMKVVPDQIVPFAPRDRSFTALGTDGFGRSDTREALRRFFETDAAHVQLAVLAALAQGGAVDRSTVADCIKRNEIDADVADPRTR